MPQLAYVKHLSYLFMLKLTQFTLALLAHRMRGPPVCSRLKNFLKGFEKAQEFQSLLDL